MKKITDVKLVVLISIFIVIFNNLSFFKNVTNTYHPSPDNIGFLFSLPILLTIAIAFPLLLVSSKYTTKAILIIFLLVSSLASYFMNEYGVVIDHIMIQNLIKTDLAEVRDLINFELFLYFLLLGLLPALLVYKAPISYGPWKTELKSKAIALGIFFLMAVFPLLVFGSSYASFFREHKPLRYYLNPLYMVYSTGKYINQLHKPGPTEIILIGLDARIPPTDLDRELIVLVVGETARADRFSLNGYDRETNPLLKNEEVISFTNFYSCGTSTATSVPCMFSSYSRDEYNIQKARTHSNLLDVLKVAGVNVLWRDNNSTSKGVALRVPHEDFKSSSVNPACDIECRDEGMLVGLQGYINEHKTGDILIILHQMGNHGPAYYKRYPESNEFFKPTCKSNHLEKCSAEEINNSYDNAIRYTDYFLSKTIQLLQANSGPFETAMFYISDHGESLGENGLYLHGLPYFMAPDAQKHIPAIMWFGSTFQVDRNKLKNKASKRFSHDNVFHTILGSMEIDSKVYNENLDILSSKSISNN